MKYNELNRLAQQQVHQRLTRENELRMKRENEMRAETIGGASGGHGGGYSSQAHSGSYLQDQLQQYQREYQQVPQNEYQQIQDQMLERVRELQNQGQMVQPAWVGPQYQPWDFGMNAYTNEVIPRNNYGEPMYDKRCTECRKHEEERMICDLCESNVTYVRVHVMWKNTDQLLSFAMGNQRNQKKVESKQRKEELSHFCPRAEEVLLQILQAAL